MKNREKKFKINIYAIVVGLILAIYAISVIGSLLWGVLTSLKYRTDFMDNLLGLPNMEIWEKKGGNIFTNYTSLFSALEKDFEKTFHQGWNLDIPTVNKSHVDFFGFTLNTLLYAGGSAFFGALAPCIMGYMCSKFKYKFSGIIYGFVLLKMVMPMIGNTTAVITLMRRFCIYDTIWGMWIKNLTFENTYFLIFYAFFSGVSDTYAEAAQLDGASYFRVMFTIYIPLAIKTFSTIFLLQFVAMYNDYNTSLLYIPTHPTLAYAVLIFGGQHNSGANVPFNFAAAMALAMPMVIVFVIFKNKLMGNISVGGVKE
ncbi:MAG: carbohydrate ABC transporter permease [Clostridiales bacterium]|nr:carbohydrate ABC transporter permease [Clostridiales bacterium]